MATRSRTSLRAYWAALPKEVLSVDGARVRIRPLAAADLARERAFVQGLSTETIYHRLLGSGVNIDDEGLLRLVDVDQRNHVALAATVCLNDGAEAIVGVGRYVTRPADRSAEFAVTVADAWQGKGIGTALLTELIQCGRAAGLATLVGELLAGNEPMLGLLRKFGFQVARHAGDAGIAVAVKRLRRIRRVVLPAGILA